VETNLVSLDFLRFVHDLVADLPGSEGGERKVVRFRVADPGFRLPAGSLVIYEVARILLSDHWYLIRTVGQGLEVRKVARIETAPCLVGETGADQWCLENGCGEIETALVTVRICSVLRNNRASCGRKQ